MPTIPGATVRGRYIIRARQADDPSALSAFLEEIKQDPSMKVIDLIGPKDHPNTAVVEMGQDLARSLAQRFQATNELMIEPDRPVSMFN